MKIKLKIFLGFWVIILFTIVLGITTFVNANEVGSRFTFLVEHDLNVLQNAQKLQNLVVDAEAGQRGFVITGDEIFLEPYYNGMNQFNDLLEVEKKLVSDNPPQVKRLVRINELFVEWKTKAAVPEIELARTVHESGIDAIDLEALISAGAGKAIQDEIHENLEVLEVNLELIGNHEARILVFAIAKDVINRETGQRGFLITGKEEFLEPFTIGDTNLQVNIEKLQNMLEGDQKNLQILDNVKFLAEEWKTKAGLPEIVLKKRMNGNPDILDVAALLQAGTGKSILDQIRIEFDEFILIENKLKNQRFATALEIERNTENTVTGVTIFIIIAGLVVAFFINHSISTPIKYLREASNDLAKGKFKKEIRVSGDDELTDLTKTFNKMANSLKQSKKSLQEKILELQKMDVLKEEFSTMVSHELKTPLTPIKGYCEMLTGGGPMGELSTKQLKAVQEIDRNATRLEDLISDILDTQKLDMEKMVLNKKTIPLAEFMVDMQKDLSYLMENKEIWFVNTNSEKINLSSDENRLRQIMDNLVKNAVDFVPEKTGRIEIGTQIEENKVIFFVRDNGVGISEKDQKNLFKKFYQVDTSLRRKHGGTGLGLVICKGLVERLGGQIWVESEEGKGSTFYFDIPIKEEINVRPQL